MQRAYYSNSIYGFISESNEQILGKLVSNNAFPLENNQRDAWVEELHILKSFLGNYEGQIYFEFAIPRMGKRVDVLLLIESIIFVLEFKVGDHQIQSYAIDQVWDYALDLKNFHETSFDKAIIPVLIATEARINSTTISLNCNYDRLCHVLSR